MTAMPPALVTGGSGFLGRHLLDRLGGTGSVVAIGRHRPRDWPERDFQQVDLEDPAAVDRAIRDIGPGTVYHLAGRTPPANPSALYRGNTLATSNLIRALRHWARPVRVILAGSAAEIGPTPIVPVAEDISCRPADAYGLSKWCAARVGLQAGPPLEVIVARLFNPIGPGAPATQAFGRFARMLAAPGDPALTLRVGNLDARRDFLDARDVAAGLIALADSGRPGSVYHLASGRSRSIAEGLDVLIRLSGRAVLVDTDSRPPGPGPRDSRADIGKILADTDWRPAIPFEQSLEDLWRETTGRDAPRGPHFATTAVATAPAKRVD